MSDPYASIARPADPYAGIATRAAPGAKRRSMADEVGGFMANVNRGLGVGDELAAGAGTAIDVARGRTPVNDIAGGFRRRMADQRSTEDAFAARQPRAAALARGTGMAATAALPAGGQANLFAQGSRAANMARGAVLAGSQAAVYAAADRGTARERLDAASRAALDPVTLALGAGGGALATLRRGKAPKRVNEDVALLAREGVRLTPGQIGGKFTKTAEEAATSIPFAGDRIAKRMGEAQDSFDLAVLNRALKQIGEKMPAAMAAGTDAVRYASDRLSAAYRRVLPEGTIKPDARFVAEARKVGPIMETTSDKAKGTLATIIEKRITAPSAADGGVLSGRTFKKIETGLDTEINRFSGSSDPEHVALTEALNTIKNALGDMAARQNPQFKAAKDAIDRGWATIAQAETAAAAAGSEAGKFTAKQFTAALRAGDKRIRRRGFARGEVLNQDIAQAGERVLAQSVPDSGTGRRVMQGAVGLSLGGAGASTGTLVPMAATIGGISVAYSPKAVALANRLLGGRIARQEQQALLAQLRAEASRDPRVADLYRQVAAKLARAAGVAGGARAAEQPNYFARP